MTNGHGDQSYEERNNRPDNYGEQLFVDYCRLEGYKLHRIGFDEKQDKVQGFYNLNKVIRQLPDYVCLSPASGRMAVVSVKGTNKFKQEDFNNLNWLETVYSTPKAPLRFVFAIRGQVYWYTTSQVSELYRQATTEAHWPDGKTYRELDIK
jgi:hypothetical protein